jgi:hypothetical protein
MRAVSVIAMVVLFVAASLWWLMRDAGPSAPPAHPANAHVDAAPSPTGVDEPAPRAELDVESRAPTPADDTATVRGRCVDATGSPLAGVTVSVRGRATARAREQPTSPWTDPERQQTATDGHFAIRFVPPVTHAFEIEGSAPDRPSWIARWSNIAAGADIDLGDVVMLAGSIVRGRVVDPSGQLQRDVAIALERDEFVPGPTAQPAPRQTTRSGNDGTFAFAAPFATGAWRLHVDDLRLVRPEPVVVLGKPEHVLELVVDPLPEQPTIEGVVVDEHDVPIARANVRAYRERRPVGNGYSDARGAFRTTRSESDTSEQPVTLTVDAPGFERLETPIEHRFGTKDVRLVLRRGLGLDVVVVRASDGTPVEDFGVRLIPGPELAGATRINPRTFRGGQHHANGIARIRGVARGRYSVWIEPVDTNALCTARFVEAMVADGAPSVVEVRLAAPSTRTVVVERADGTPAVGSTVELLLGDGTKPVTLQTVALPAARWLGSTGIPCLQIASATTDTNGACELRDAPSTTFAVRVTGPAHRAVLVENVRLDDPTPLRIVVPGAARLVGRLAPAVAIDELRAMAGSGGPRPLELSVHLQRRVGDAMESIPVGRSSGGAAIGADGTFVVDGIPAGTWSVRLQTWRTFAPGNGIGVTEVLDDAVTFDDGETKTQAFDISALRPARLRARAMLDGELVIGKVQVVCAGHMSMPATTDADGRLDLVLAAGEWKLQPIRTLPGAGRVTFDPPEVAVLKPGTTVEQTFHAWSASARLRAVAPDGTPVPDIAFHVSRDMVRALAPPTTSRADGTFELHGAPGVYELRARIRSLTDAQAYAAFLRTQPTPEAAAAATIVVGTVTLPGGADVVDLRLPPEWDR